MLRIGNSLYTLHNAATCVKIGPKSEHCHSNDGVRSGLWTRDEDFTDLYIEMAANDSEIKTESIENDETDQNIFEDYGEATESIEADGFDDFDSNIIDKTISIPSSANATETSQSSSSPSVFHTKCGICNKLFSNLNELDEHIQNVHMPSEKLKCNI